MKVEIYFTMDKEEDGISDDATASDPRSLRARARALEGRLGALRKIPKDELKPADAEERDACVSELKKLARVFAGELAGTLSDAQRARMRAAYKDAGPEAVQGFKKVLEAMMDADMRRAYAKLRD